MADDSENAKYALLVQSAYRGHKARKESQDKLEQKNAQQDSGTESAHYVQVEERVGVLEAVQLCFQWNKFTIIVVLLGVLQILAVNFFLLVFSLIVDDVTTLDAQSRRAYRGVVDGKRLAVAFVAAIIVAAIVMTKNLVVGQAHSNLNNKQRIAMINNMKSKSITWFERVRMQDIARTLGEHVDIIGEKVFYGAITSFWSLVNITAALVVVGIISAASMGITIAVVPLLGLTTFAANHHKKRLFALYNEYSTQSNAELAEFCSRIRPIRAAGMEAKEVEDYISNTRDAERIQLRMERIDAVSSAANIAVGAAIFCLLLWFDGNLVETNRMSVGKMMSCLAISGFTIYEFALLFESLSDIWEGTHEAGVALFVLARTISEDGNASYGIQPANFADEDKGAIVFEGVRLRNPANFREQVLDGVDLSIPAGSSMAIVGQAGCGKSFIVGLLARFYVPDSGRVLVDGLEVHKYDKSFQKQVGLVTQEHMMLNGTIAYNIAYGAEDTLSLDDVIQAAKIADAHGFIMALPEGYDTVIGDGYPVVLAASQLKRLSIARVFAQNKPIVILDDPCVDLRDRADVVRTALKRMLRNPVRRTAICICHDVADTQYMDYVATFANGKVVESGLREALAKDDGSSYSSLVRGERKYTAGRSAMSPGDAVGVIKGGRKGSVNTLDESFASLASSESMVQRISSVKSHHLQQSSTLERKGTVARRYRALPSQMTRSEPAATNWV